MYLKQYISLIDQHISTSMTDTDGIITCVSDAFCNMSGYSRDELLGKKHTMLRHCDMEDEIYQDLWTTITQGKSWRGRIKNRAKSQESYWVEAFIEPIFEDGNIVGYQALRINITDEKLLETLAHIDSLTGLFNRHTIEEYIKLFLDESHRYQRTFALIMIDLDDFKQVNDTYGHQAGDEVLKKLSELFQNLLRSSDKIGRWGGEEFLILLPQTTAQQAFELSERLRSSFELYEFKEIGHRTASFGIALMESNDTVDSLIAKADKALYHSKDIGKNHVTLF